jgi:predicted phage terminase large subunit-like protein
MAKHEWSAPQIPWTEEQVLTEKAERSLRVFTEQAWPVIEPQTPFVPNWHIDAICEHLEAVTRGQLHYLLILVPPRHTKSILVAVMWPAWEWIRQPGTRWLFSSYDGGLSVRDAVKCRRLFQSVWYRKRWGQTVKLTGDQNAKERYENTKGGYRIATSVGGSATGEGGDRIVCDDPANIKFAESDTVRQSIIDWWDTVMSTRANDPANSARVIIMQRCHAEDLAGHVIAQGGWEVLTLPAEFESRFACTTSIGFRDPRTEDEELLWPARFPRPEIDSLKLQLGAYAAAAQLQQRPAPRGGGIVKRTWWRFYRDLPPKFDEVIQSWDMAFKDLNSSSYVTGQVWGRVGANKYLIDQDRRKMRFTETLRAVRALSAKYPKARAKLVEDKANGPAVMDTLRGEIPGLIAVEPAGSKVSRLEATSPDIEAGNVYLPDPALNPWVEEYMSEFDFFPRGAFDDQVDGTTQALLRFQRRSRRRQFAPIVSETRPSGFQSMGERQAPSVWSPVLTTR